MYPENLDGTQVIVGSMNMRYISDTARNRTHNLFRHKREPIPLGHSDGLKDPMSQIFCMAKKGGPFPFNTIENRKRFYKLKYCICNRYINKLDIFSFYPCSVCRWVEVAYSPHIPPLVPQPPSVFICFLTGLVENNQKYIADHFLVLPQIEYWFP